MYSTIALEKSSDITVNFDQMTGNPEYELRITEQLKKMGIDGIDFSDCCLPYSNLSEGELLEFRGIEDRVVSLFLDQDYTKASVETALAMQAKAQRACSAQVTANDGAKARKIARRLLDRVSHLQEALRIKDASLKTEMLQRKEILKSTSWRITKILRMVSNGMKNF